MTRQQQFDKLVKQMDEANVNLLNKTPEERDSIALLYRNRLAKLANFVWDNAKHITVRSGK